MNKLPFNKPHITRKELEYIHHAHELGMLAGDGHYTKLCNKWFMREYNAKALLTHSCTAALEMSALLADIKPGDEVIMPSYTFVSTANAVVLRGGVPVFIDIEEQTLNIDVNLIEAAITPRTKAIMVVHYAGISCNMDLVIDIAKRHGLLLIEDAAQAIFGTYKGELLGTLGDLGSLSFHETKNIISGEGGALLINNDNLYERAEIIREKGTDRSRFFRGQVDKYTWVDVGSSYLPGELVAAFLYGQLESAREICQKRIDVWNRYNDALADLEKTGLLRRPHVPHYASNNGHMFYILLHDLNQRTAFIEFMKQSNISPVFHYIPLHSSPAGKKYTRVHGNMNITDSISDRIVRLPLFYDIGDQEIEKVIDVTHRFFEAGSKHG